MSNPAQTAVVPAGTPRERGVPAPSDDFRAALTEHIRAGYQCLWITTSEENRVEFEIHAVAKDLKQAVVTWDDFEGFNYKGLEDPKYRQPVVALETIANPDTFGKQPTVVILRDIDDYFAAPPIRRRIRSLCEGNRMAGKDNRRTIIILSPSGEIHPRVRAHITTVDFKLPNELQLLRMVQGLQAGMNARKPGRGDCDPELIGQVVRCLLGLTSTEAENCLARCLVRHSGFDPTMLSAIKDEKAATIKKSGTLTYVPESSQADRTEIGGYDAFITWLGRRKKAYTEAARANNIDYPKGVVLLGVPGTGKSMVAAGAAKLLGLPVYIFDVAAVFDKHVGGSEQRMREALQQVEAQQGCVLLIDEADKALGNATNSVGDSGVTQRVFGTLLTWLATKQSPTFVIMTVNRTDGLPPELLRAGRFDAVFFTEMPGPLERREILEIHLRKRGVAPESLPFEQADWDTIVEKMKDFVGSEIEEVVKEARYLAFDQHGTGTPTFEQLQQAASDVIPMSKRDPDGMKKITEFCAGKGRPVNTPTAAKSRTKRAPRDVDIG